MTRVIAASLALALFAACQRPPETAPPAPLPIMGTRWNLQDGGGDAPTMEFSENRANGYGGCNHWFAQVETAGSTLRFSAIGATKRLCSPDVMEQERAFFANLDAIESARLELDTLILLDAAGVERARFTRTR